MNIKELINTYVELEELMRTIEGYTHSTQDKTYYRTIEHLHKTIVNFNKFMNNKKEV